MNAPVRLAAPRPLYVDLDRTLTRADVSLEAFLRFARTGIGPALLLVWWLIRGRAVAKAMVARRTRLDPASLPYRDEVLALIRAARADGRPVILASASHRRHVAAVARHLGLFDRVVATARGANLKGTAKLARIRADAAGAFDYCGDARADRTIWTAAHAGHTVGHLPRGGTATRLGTAPAPLAAALLRAMRPHQWAKNALLAVPLATAGLWADPAAVARVALAALLFSLAASGVYLLNDLLDIDADRLHASKRRRPLASGALPIPVAVPAAAALLMLAPAAALLALGPAFAAVLVGYLALTTAYSLRLKQVMTLDAIVLACLYTVRILAGAVTLAVPLSFWLLAFSIFAFLSLAFLKRYTELAGATSADRLLSGRGYVGGDLPVVMMSGLSAGFVSVLVLALFINSVTLERRYAGGTPELLWLLCLVLLYWISRTWMMARRGEVHGDPVVFALTDRRSLWLAATGAAIMLAAQTITLPVALFR